MLIWCDCFQGVRRQRDGEDGHFAGHVGADHHHRQRRKDLLRHRVEARLGRRASPPHPELSGGSPELRLHLPDPAARRGCQVPNLADLVSNFLVVLDYFFKPLSKVRVHLPLEHTHETIDTL